MGKSEAIGSRGKHLLNTLLAGTLLEVEGFAVGVNLTAPEVREVKVGFALHAVAIDVVLTRGVEIQSLGDASA